MDDSVTRETWRQAVRDRHLNAATLAHATGKSHRAVRSYLEGTRRPSDAWLRIVAALIEGIDTASERGAA